MTFFYDLNKKLDSIREKPEVTHGQLNERDMGKHNNKTTGFDALAKKAGKEYGSKAAGERVAGAQFQKMKKSGKIEEEGMSRAAKGYEKYGKEGMQALAKAGREGKALDPVRNKYDKYDEGIGDVVKKVGSAVKKVGGAVLNKIGHGSDEDMRKDLQRKMGMPQTGKKPEQVKEKMSPARAQSFAALAPPKDKITFADKIAGAKKEVDEMLGDVAAEAIKGALSGKQKQLDKNNNGKLDAQDFEMLRRGGKTSNGGTVTKTKTGMKHSAGPGRYGGSDEESHVVDRLKGPSTKNLTGKQVADEGWDEMEKDVKSRMGARKVGDVTHGDKHDTQEVPGGRRVTRRVDPNTGYSVGADSDEPAAGEKRGRGRPKGADKGPERVTSRATKHKGGRKTNEGDFGTMEEGQNELKAAMALLKKAGYKVSKAVEEESTTTRDNRAERAGRKVAKDIEYDEKKKDGIHGKKRGSEDDRAENAGKKVTKDIEYDEKKKKVKEQGGADTPTASSGFSFGKGIYDSLNRELEGMISEGMNVNMSMNSDANGGPSKSITVTATDDDAMKLGQLLKMAGLGGGDYPNVEGGADLDHPGAIEINGTMDADGAEDLAAELRKAQHDHVEGAEECPTCGSSDCGCDEVDEAAVSVSDNQPDWPTDQETAQDNFEYSGGLNKPKSTGQSTVPVLASQEERQHTYESDLQRIRDIAGIKEAKKVDEDDMEEGNKFTGNLAKARADGKKQADLDGDGDMEKVDEGILASTANLWKEYKGQYGV